MIEDYIQTINVKYKPYDIFAYIGRTGEVWLPEARFINPQNGYTKEQHIAVNFLTCVAAKARHDMGEKAISPDIELLICNKAALLICYREDIIDKEPDNVPPQSVQVVEFLTKERMQP